MLKLHADMLRHLGAPVKAGALPIEDWLRHLMQCGTLRLPDGLHELRGPVPIVTTLNDLKSACGVALETVKQGLRPLETDHWVQLVDGAHTRLLGPPRFTIRVTKENFWGSVSQAVEISVTDGLNPLESVDYDALRQPDRQCDRKRVLGIEALRLNWSSQVRLADGKTTALKPEETFTLGAGSQITSADRSLLLEEDLPAVYDGSRDLRTLQSGEFRSENGDLVALPDNSAIHLERNGLVRLANGKTGIIELSAETTLSSGEPLDWNLDTHWLSRFQTGQPLVLLRRAIFADLLQVVQENCAGVSHEPDDHWRVVLGFHDTILDGTLPYRAGLSSLKQSPNHLTAFLHQLTPDDSLRKKMSDQYGVVVGNADVRLSPASFASSYDRHWLRKIGADPEINSEILAQPNRIPCWTQMGAYYRRGEVWPWEITREVYFTYVQVHFRQRTGDAGR